MDLAHDDAFTFYVHWTAGLKKNDPSDLCKEFKKATWLGPECMGFPCCMAGLSKENDGELENCV